MNHKATYEKDGYLVVRGLLDVERDIHPIQKAYASLLDSLAEIYTVEAGGPSLEGMTFQERFAASLGASAGQVLHHLDPVLNIFQKNYKWRTDLPAAQIPEMFNLIRHEKVLDVLEELIGGEVFSSPIYHVNMKLCPDHLKMAEQIAKSNPNGDLSDESFYTFQVGKTGWHMDSISGLKDSHTSDIAVAWIPISEANEENGCLLVIPGSHKGDVVRGPFDEDVIEKGIPLPVVPGDVVFLHNKLLHGSIPNTSKNGLFRWAFNFRFLPVGQPCGRPFMPGFVARSRSAPDTELRNPYIWGAMWQRALGYLATVGTPYAYSDLANISSKEAGRISQHWHDLAPDVNGWLRVGG